MTIVFHDNDTFTYENTDTQVEEDGTWQFETVKNKVILKLMWNNVLAFTDFELI